MLTVIFDLQDVESMSIDLPVSLRAICGKSCYFYKTVFSGISPVFKLVVLFGLRDDSWVFLNVFLNGHNIKRVHLCSK